MPERLTDEDRAAMREYWAFYEPISEVLADDIRSKLAAVPEWASILRSMTPHQMKEQDARSKRLQRQAIMDGDWSEYVDDLHAQGVQYARMGLEFERWYDVLRIFRDSIRRYLRAQFRGEPTSLDSTMGVADGLNLFLDIAMSHIGKAYLAEKQALIARQQVAIREMSLPVLEIRERLLVLPIVGAVDAARARDLTERLLNAIKEHRALGIVVDITGVPVVDSAVAKHLTQAFEAARMMGSHVVITGVSAEIAQTIVVSGADAVLNVQTYADIRDGLAELDRMIR